MGYIDLNGIAVLLAAAIIWFFITLVIFMFTDHSGEKKHKALKIMLAVSGGTAGILLVGVLGPVGLMMLVPANMQ